MDARVARMPDVDAFDARSARSRRAHRTLRTPTRSLSRTRNSQAMSRGSLSPPGSGAHGSMRRGARDAFFALLRPSIDHLLVWLPLGDAAAIRRSTRALRAARQGAAGRSSRTGFSAGRGADGASRGRATASIEHAGGYAFAQPGLVPRTAWLGPAADPTIDAGEREAWRLADIAAGLPWLDAVTQDEFVPQSLGLERLDAVRFDKGCYPGQEIAARLHFRGGNKHRLHRIVRCRRWRCSTRTRHPQRRGQGRRRALQRARSRRSEEMRSRCLQMRRSTRCRCNRKTDTRSKCNSAFDL